MTPEYLGVPDICVKFNISRWTWRRWVASGYAPQPANLPGHPKWRLVDLERFEQGGRKFLTTHRRGVVGGGRLRAGVPVSPVAPVDTRIPVQ